MSAGVTARGTGDSRPSSAKSSAASFVRGEFLDMSWCCHFASSCGSRCGVLQEFHGRLLLSTGELRVATPGVARSERRLVSEEVDRFTMEVRRLRPFSLTVGGRGEGLGA